MKIHEAVLWGVAIITFLGAALVYLRGASDKGVREAMEKLMETQEKQADLDRKSAEQKQATLQHQLDIQAEKIQSLQQQNHGLARQVNVLQNVVTNKDEIEHLQSTLDRHHQDTIAALEAIKAGVLS